MERRRRRQALVLAMTGGRCWYCGADVSHGMTMDHVTPRSRGGRNALANVVPSCRPCNDAKGQRTLEEWRAVWSVAAVHRFWGERRAA